MQWIETGVVITDNRQKDNPIIYANPRFQHLCGYDLTEILGHNCRFLQGPETDRNVVTKLREALRSGALFQEQLLNYRKNGSTFWNRLTISPVGRVDGEIPYFVGFQEDVTEQMTAQAERDRAERQLRVHADQLAQSNEALEKFASLASHDLREPLRTIAIHLGLVEQETENRLDPRSLESIKFVRDAAVRLGEMVQDLLNYSRIDADVPKRELLDTHELVKQVLSQLQDSMKEANARISLDLLPAVTANRTVLMLIFQNLISNAIKYRGEKPLDIRISAKDQDTEWVFSVQDSGIGILEKDFDRIFQMFERVYSRSQYPGTGIGLALCKKCVGSLGGRMWVKSEIGIGSEFCFTIPRNPKGTALL